MRERDLSAAVTTLYQNNFCEVKDFRCHCVDCSISSPEYQDTFSICYVKKGAYILKTYRDDLDCHNGYILVHKPGYDYRIGHLHNMPDEVTVFTLSAEFHQMLRETEPRLFGGFLLNPDIPSIRIRSTAEIDYLHFRLLTALKTSRRQTLPVDLHLAALLQKILSAGSHTDFPAAVSPAHKTRYLPKIDKAKEYLRNNFSGDLSLADIASYCAMSPFHFARIFKRIAGLSPYRYLLQFRLHHAEYLLKHSDMPVTEVSFDAGFQSLDHFSTAFKAVYQIQPSLFRAKQRRNSPASQ